MSRSVYFFSDMHVAGSDQRTERLLDLLNDLEGRASAIYFVGDSFDFWLGYRSVIFSAYFPFLRCVARLIESGVEVTFLSGNHDPGLGSFLIDLGAQVYNRPQSVELQGRRIYLDHGDTVDPRGLLRRGICKLARAPLLMAIARWLHPDVAWSLTRWYARKEHRYGSPLPEGLLSEYFPRRIADGHDTVIIGHYHRAVRHSDSAGQFFALGDWVKQFTYLRLEEGEFSLMRHQVNGADIQLEDGDHDPE